VSALDAAGVVLVVLGLSCLVLAVVLLRDVQEQREGVDRLLAGLEGARATVERGVPLWVPPGPLRVRRMREQASARATTLPVEGFFEEGDIVSVTRTGERMRVVSWEPAWVGVVRGVLGTIPLNLREGDELMVGGRVEA
jgi:hypothetical protein